jgi:hypothetical protein
MEVHWQKFTGESYLEAQGRNGSPNFIGIFFQGTPKKEGEPKKRSLNKKYKGQRED